MPTTREQVMEMISKLPEKDLERLKEYGEYLVWRSKHQTKSDAQRILEAINQSHEVTMEDAEALLQSIEESKMPVNFDSPFEQSHGYAE